MVKSLQERKVFYWLIILALITTPLFGILGGTPFLTFKFSELNDFLPAIYFIAIITLSFWIINISLLALSSRFHFLQKIIFRALISIMTGLILSTTAFHVFRELNPPPPFGMQIQHSMDTADFKRPVFLFGAGKATFRFDGKDSGSRPGYFRDLRGNRESIFFFPQVIRSLTINIIILTLCELVFLYFRKQKIENENARLHQSNLEARNNQLKMQLHPHFLFNSLNTMRLLLKKDPDKAEDYLLKLSEMLRFSTTSALQDLVNVEDELKLCISYLQMQKVRFGDMLFYSISNEQLYRAKGKLPVYSLQLLVENAIKHNSLTIEKPLTIFIEYDQNVESVTVKNKIQPRRITEATTKTGLKNLEERYRLLSKEGINVTDTGEDFIVSIKILHTG